MPKLFNTNIVAILLAAVAGYMMGYAWYGALFMEKWEALTGMGGDADMEPSMFALGFALTAAQAVGLAAILNWRKAVSLPACVITALITAALLIVTTHAADTLYQKEPLELLWIDGSHALVSFAVMGVIYSLFRK